MPRFVDDWRSAWRIREFGQEFLVSAVVLFVALILMWAFLGWVETREGVVLRDPFLSLFSPIDLKWISYSLIYSGWLLGLLSLCLDPFALLLMMRTLILVIVLRIACLYLLPLDPPPDIIPLVDPLMQWLSIRAAFTRDLFFSWHTAVLALLAFTARWRDMKIIFASVAVAVSLLLLLQHAQYVIDVLAAPCFAYVAYRIAKGETIEKVSQLPGVRHADKPKDIG